MCSEGSFHSALGDVHTLCNLASRKPLFVPVDNHGCSPGSFGCTDGCGCCWASGACSLLLIGVPAAALRAELGLSLAIFCCHSAAWFSPATGLISFDRADNTVEFGHVQRISQFIIEVVGNLCHRSVRS